MHSHWSSLPLPDPFPLSFPFAFPFAFALLWPLHIQRFVREAFENFKTCAGQLSSGYLEYRQVLHLHKNFTLFLFISISISFSPLPQQHSECCCGQYMNVLPN